MSRGPTSPVTSDEIAVEDRYNKGLDAKAKAAQLTQNRLTANTWTTSIDVRGAQKGELIGRVALNQPSDVLGGRQDFYIGTAAFSDDALQVFSWAAPVACTYFRGSDPHHELCDDVAGVRVFARQGGRIVDHQDEALVDRDPDSLFPRQRLTVPAAPRVTSPRPSNNNREPAPPDVTQSTRPILVPPTLPRRPAAPQLPPPGPKLRAPDLLQGQLKAPKTVSMSAVLSTLQPDQYEAIARPARDSRFFQGHPGTGKTIIAAHRAAYLLNRETPQDSRARGKVLVIGPTAEYSNHIRGVIDVLVEDPESYEVRSLGELLDELSDVTPIPTPTSSLIWEDANEGLAHLVDLALQRSKENLGRERPNSRDVYSELVGLRDDVPSEGLDKNWFDYLRELPGHLDELKRLRLPRYRGLLAYIGVRTSTRPRIGHVIVDEAQDVYPLEWQVLGRLGNSGGWTILGDLNQRRTDYTYGTWDRVAEVLAVDEESGAAPISVLERSYRSTAQIMKFANQLLPARDRAIYSLQQDGDAPDVIRVTTERALVDSAVSSAIQLVGRVGSGTVALISGATHDIGANLRQKGWLLVDPGSATWQQGPMTLRVLPPERARGLEFDGVVVVEPAAFPANLGRQGVLYTALTRANRLLTIVHYRSLPAGLRARL